MSALKAVGNLLVLDAGPFADLGERLGSADAGEHARQRRSVVENARKHHALPAVALSCHLFLWLPAFKGCATCAPFGLVSRRRCRPQVTISRWPRYAMRMTILPMPAMLPPSAFGGSLPDQRWKNGDFVADLNARDAGAIRIKPQDRI
jgi:hypothetical protein